MTDDAQLRARAVRRWRWRMILPGILGGVVGPFLGDYLSSDRRDHEPVLEHVIAAFVGIGVMAGVILFITRRRPQLFAGDGFFSAPLAAGVGRRQRRAAARAVRQIRPSDDPLQQSVERDLASRAVRHQRGSLAVLGLLSPLSLAVATFSDVTPAGRIYLVVAAGLFALLTGWTAFLARRSRAYLRAAPPTS